jgi:hypothetical protein
MWRRDQGRQGSTPDKKEVEALAAEVATHVALLSGEYSNTPQGRKTPVQRGKQTDGTDHSGNRE